MPSAPIGVVIFGVCVIIASSNFPLSPAPKRNGAKQTRAWPITKDASSAQPLTKKPILGLFKAVALGGG